MRSATNASYRTASSHCTVRLWLGADEGNRVIYDATAETLTIGCYGRFVPEDSIRRRDDDEIIAAEPFNEPAE